MFDSSVRIAWAAASSESEKNVHGKVVGKLFGVGPDLPTINPNLPAVLQTNIPVFPKYQRVISPDLTDRTAHRCCRPRPADAVSTYPQLHPYHLERAVTVSHHAYGIQACLVLLGYVNVEIL